MKALAVCGAVDDQDGIWINQVTSRIYPLPLSDEIVERMAKAAYELVWPTDFWSGVLDEAQERWRTAIRAAAMVLVED